MYKDPIVEELHEIRRKHAASFNYDLHAICESLRKAQESSGRNIITKPLRAPSVPNVLQAVAEGKEGYGE